MPSLGVTLVFVPFSPKMAQLRVTLNLATLSSDFFLFASVLCNASQFIHITDNTFY